MWAGRETEQNAPTAIAKPALAAIICACLVFAKVSLSLHFFNGWGDSGQSIKIAAFFTSGVLLSFATVFLIRRIIAHRLAALRSAPVLAALTLIGCLGFTALLLALEYRLYFAQWHAPFPTKIWILQNFFTAAGSTFQFIVLGLRYLGVSGAAIILLTSWWANRSMD